MASLAERILAVGRTNPIEQMGSLAQRILGAVPQTGTLKASAQTPAFPTPASAVPLWQKILGGQQGETLIQTWQRAGAENTAATKAAFDPNASPELRKKGQDIYAGMTFGFTGTLQNVAKKGAVKGIQSLKGSADDLTTQARKYKTAEEFVGSQGTPVYHGTGKEFDQFMPVKSTRDDLFNRYEVETNASFFSRDKAMADKFSKLDGGKPRVIEAYVPTKKPFDIRTEGIPSAKATGNNTLDGVIGDKIWEILDKKNIRISGGYDEWQIMDIPEIVKLLKDNGYDSVLLMEKIDPNKIGGLTESVVGLYPDQIKTKSQLINIWNKAHNK